MLHKDMKVRYVMYYTIIVICYTILILCNLFKLNYSLNLRNYHHRYDCTTVVFCCKFTSQKITKKNLKKMHSITLFFAYFLYYS